MSKKLRSFETLESRKLLASVWQSAPNQFDVDGSGFVVPIDALLIINDLHDNGFRELPNELPEGYTGVKCDVNGDGQMTPTDALEVINTLNDVPSTASIQVDLDSNSDLNSDYVVLKPDVIYNVVSSPNTSVKVERLEGESVISSSGFQTDDQGKASIPLTLNLGANNVRFSVTNSRGFSGSTERLTRYGDVVLQWNAAMLDMVRETTNVLSTGVLVKPPPPMVSKYLAMVHGAMFDAVNALDGSYQGYAYTDHFSSGSQVAAASYAAYNVARNLYSTEHQAELWNKTLAEVLATIPDDDARAEGMTIGQHAAEAMIARRANDGSSNASTYQPVDQIGRWQPTLPNFAEPTLPQWPNVTPFGLTDGSQFRPAAPPALTSSEYAAAVDQVMQLGSAESSTRTDDQTEIAHFWADGGGTATPPGHWNIIAQDAVAPRNLSLIESARTFALLNYALADAGIGAWDAKYQYDLWRPIDAIRKASQDGNNSTTEEASWTPLLDTPSFPSYTSGHSTFSGAASAVLTALLGDSQSFVAWADPGSTGAWPPSDDTIALSQRSFSNFQQAADEAGMSRIYGGIHYSFDNTAGLASGGSIGSWDVSHLLQPKQP